MSEHVQKYVTKMHKKFGYLIVRLGEGVGSRAKVE